MKVRLSDRYEIEFVIDRDQIDCTWYPDLPDGLTQDEHAAYLRARDDVLLEYAARLGLGGVIVANTEQDGAIETVLLEDDRDLH